jgi:NADH:ubiquinone oxidoreductase subunit C
MYKKYQFPMNIFIAFEKLDCIVYTSNVMTPNHYVCFIPNNSWQSISSFLKNELFYSFSFLSEISAVDTLKYSEILPETDIELNNNRYIVFYNFYTYQTKIRLTFILNFNDNHRLVSLDQTYKNSSWLEREVSEMFGIPYTLKKDSRVLLLDYSRADNPLNKNYPTEGYRDIHYSFFENQLSYINNDYVEL